MKFTALVHSFSNLRMTCTLAHDSYEPGATLTLRARLQEYGEPLPPMASVRADLFEPDGSSRTVTLSPVGGAVYEASVPAGLPGIYRFVVSASGATSRGKPFTRHQVVTGAVWRGGDTPSPRTDDGVGNDADPSEAFCRVLRCMTSAMEPELRKRLEAEGFSVEKLLECVCR